MIKKININAAGIRFLIRAAVLLLPVSMGAATAEETRAVYAYDIEHRLDTLHVKGRVDPTRPQGQRIKLYFPEYDTLPEELREEIKHLDQTPIDSFFCADANTFIPRDLRLIGTNQNLATYEFRPQAGQDPDEQLIFPHLKGVVIKDISSGEIVTLRLFSEKSFKLSWAVKIKSFETTMACEPTPDGRTYAAVSETKVKGSAAFANFEEYQHTAISNIAEVDVQ